MACDKITRIEYDKLVFIINEWCDEHRFETSLTEDIEILNNILNALKIKRGF